MYCITGSICRLSALDASAFLSLICVNGKCDAILLRLFVCY